MSVAGIPFDVDQLCATARKIDPAVMLVPEPIFRRIIARHFALAPGQHLVHEICFDIGRDELALMTDLISSVAVVEQYPERVLLLPLSEEGCSRGSQLLDLWRRLFHARIDRIVEQAHNDFRDDSAQFNATLLHEIRGVLEAERRLPPIEGARTLYREFTAFLLELHFFAPSQIEAYFPGLADPRLMTERLTEQTNAREIFSATRPPGVSMPGSEHHADSPDDNLIAPPSGGSADDCDATRAAERGNEVRAAILFAKHNRVAEAEERLHHLVERLRLPLRFNSARDREWYDALRPLLGLSAQGYWPVAGRLMFELQKACLDVERKVYAVDAVESLVTFGKHPVKRLLTKPRDTNILRRLRLAMKLSHRAGLTPQQSDRLNHLLHDTINVVEQSIRSDNRPILCQTLDEVGIVPENQAERIARDKLVEELLDTICLRGFFKMSDLRDAIARNRIKLKDLSGPVELVLGDPIIKANRTLPLTMDGVYRRGEVYLRTFQRGSSLAFGTPLGRLLMTFAVLPFGGAYVFLEGLHHFLGFIVHFIRFVDRHVVGSGTAPEAIHAHAHSHSPITSNYAIALVGLFFLALIHLPSFRWQVALHARFLLLDLPARFLRSPLMQLIYDNRITRFFGHYLLTSFVVGFFSAVAMRVLHFDWETTALVGTGTALIVSAFFRTPWGRGIEERLDDAVAHVWRIVSVNFLLGLLTLILQVFSVLLEVVEKGMYAVEEWLRFREGDGSISFVLKLLFGGIWFFIAYIFRFAWNLLVEPQVNPIKHFPVVTVSHKLLLPMVPNLAATFGMRATEMGTIVFFIPGIFGFLVWELKENWRLYKANRSPVIGPVPVGSHGERVRALLRPGFHSGVVPKTYAKWRKALSKGNGARAAKQQHQLEHIAHSVRHLAERELIAYLTVSKRWGGLPINVERIRLATNRLRIYFRFDHNKAVTISLEERGGWLIGSIEERSGLDQLDSNQQMAFQDALLELYKLSGVDVLREQAASLFHISPERVDCRPEGLIILSSHGDQEVFIDVDDSPTLTPSGTVAGRTLAPLLVNDLILSENQVGWQEWTDRLEMDQAGKCITEPILKGYRMF